MTVEQQTLQWLAGEWIDEDRSNYEVQVDSDFSCSVKTGTWHVRCVGRGKGSGRFHGSFLTTLV